MVCYTSYDIKFTVLNVIYVFTYSPLVGEPLRGRMVGDYYYRIYYNVGGIYSLVSLRDFTEY